MQKHEFKTWLDDYQRRCWSGVKQFVDRHDCYDVWFEDLEHQSLEDCLEANKQLRGENCPKFEAVPAAVASKAFSIKRQRAAESAQENPQTNNAAAKAVQQFNQIDELDEAQSETDNIKQRYVDGQRTYKCKDCHDTGLVNIVARESVTRALDEMQSDPPEKFGVHFEDVFCHCRIGEIKRADFANAKCGGNAERKDNLYRRLPVYGDHDFHVHASLIRDALTCPECKRSKTLDDWNLKGMKALECKSCCFVFHEGDDLFEPDHVKLIVILHKRKSEIERGNETLASYTDKALQGAAQ